MNVIKAAVSGSVTAAGLTLAQIGESLGIPNLDPSAGNIFVTGGTGAVGYRVALRLLNAGYPNVRVGSHHPEAAENLNKLGAEIADFSWKDENTFPKALEGIKSVLCTAPYIEKWQDKFPLFIKACREAGVKHIVKISFYHSRKSGDIFAEVPLVQAHGDCDELLINSGISYTILAPTHFMSNALVHQGDSLRADRKPATFYGASAGKGVNYVSPNDVAEVAVHALLKRIEHYNREYALTGPTSITDQEVAQLLTKHLGKPIMYVDQPSHTFEDSEKNSGDPEWLIKDLMALEKVKASGKEEDPNFPTGDIEQICGHKAETFEEYLENKEYMTVTEAA